MAGGSTQPHYDAAMLETAVRIKQPRANGADVTTERVRRYCRQPPRPARLDVIVQEHEDVAPRVLDSAVVECSPIEGPRISEDQDIGILLKILNQGPRFRIAGTIVNEDEFRRFRCRCRPDGIHTCPQKPWLVAKWDDDADPSSRGRSSLDRECAGPRAGPHVGSFVVFVDEPAQVIETG
jgi:hypothetical protein